MSPAPAALRGELGIVGVFDVCELLRLNRMTGPLVLSHQDRRGMLLFDQGMIVNAVDDRNLEGTPAAFRLLTWRAGTFEFRREPIVTSRLIQEPTEALMLEAARQLDESGLLPDGEPGAIEMLREHQGRFTALRDAFRNLAGGRAPGPGDESTASQLDSLREADDRLVLRPHAPPRLRTDGTWASASESALSDHDYRRLRVELLGASESRGKRLELPDGRALWAQAVGDGADEALWIRPIELPPPVAEDLSGPIDRLAQHLGAPGAVLIVAGRTSESTERLVHAVLEVVAQAAPAKHLVVAPCACYRRLEGPGIAVDATAALAPAAIASVGPDLVAVDASVPLAAELLAALARAPRLVLGVVASDPAAAAARAQAAVELAGGEGGLALLEGTRVAIACEEARPDRRLGFSLNALPTPVAGGRPGAGSPRTRAPQS